VVRQPLGDDPPERIGEPQDRLDRCGWVIDRWVHGPERNIDDLTEAQVHVVPHGTASADIDGEFNNMPKLTLFFLRDGVPSPGPCVNQRSIRDGERTRAGLDLQYAMVGAARSRPSRLIR
jgi:hypothetical protein